MPVTDKKCDQSLANFQTLYLMTRHRESRNHEHTTTTQPTTRANSWSNPDMEPVPMAPLPTDAPSNQAGPTPGAGPAAEGLVGEPIAHRLCPLYK